MERLTERFDGWVIRKGCHGPCRTCHRAECADIYPMIDRLAAYEDTGLEPEDIVALQKREQGFVEMLVNVSCGCAVSYSRLAELAQAEKDGRMVVLPCKVGDTVHEANKRGFISTYKVVSIHLSACSVLIGWELIDGIYSNVNGFEASALGKTVFLTREEAEAALKKRGVANEAD